MPYISGLYTGIEYVAGTVDNNADVTSMDKYLIDVVNAIQQDSIVSIFMMPSAFYTTGTSPVFKEMDVAIPDMLDGYEPRNKKLLTYPYCFLNVDCINDSKIYRYEFSGDEDLLHFAIIGGVSPNVEIILCPRNYNGSGNVGGGHGVANLTEELVMTGFPQCAFTVDAYRAWLAQKGTGFAISAFSGIGKMVASAYSGDHTSFVNSGINLAQSINSATIESTKGSTTRGNAGGDILVACRSKDFYIKRMSITKQCAKIIDDFFDKYGYATMRVKRPYRHARKYWTYVKTRDCNVFGSLPADAIKQINEIYNKGITFWVDHDKVGEYNYYAVGNTIVPADENWY